MRRGVKEINKMGKEKNGREEWKLFANLNRNEKVATLNPETNEIEGNIPYEYQTYDSPEFMYRIKTFEGELVVSPEHKVYSYVRNENYSNYEGKGLSGYDLNLNLDSTNNLPLKSEGVILANSFDNSEKTSSIKGGDISKTIIPECSSGGNNALLRKCLSNVNITLDSDIDNLDICLSESFNRTFLTSYPFCFNNLSTPIGKFSSERNLSLLAKENILFFSNEFRGICHDREYSLTCKLREVILKNILNADSCSEQLQYLPDHDPCSLKSRGTSANLTVCNNIFIELCSHNILNYSEIYKDFALQPIKDVYSDFNSGKDVSESARGELDSEDLSIVPQVLIQNELSRLGQDTIYNNDENYLSLYHNKFKISLSENIGIESAFKNVGLTNDYKNSSIISFVEKTLISDCSLNASSLDQIGHLSFNASAKIVMSLSCGDRVLACDSNSLKESLGSIFNNSSRIKSLLLNSSEFIFAYFKTSDCFFNNSSLTCSGIKSSNLKELEEEIIKLTGFGLKNETNILVSTTNSIDYQPSCLYAFQVDSLISSPILRASLSNSFSESNCFRSCSFNANLCTWDSNNLLINPDQFTSGNCSIFFLNSTGIDKVRFIVAILNDSCVIHNNSVNSQVYKPSYSEGLDNFSLQQIKDVYSDFDSGKEVYFLNSENKPIKILNITKDLAYTGKIYDVIVKNYIILVKRDGNEINNKKEKGAKKMPGMVSDLPKSYSLIINNNYINLSMHNFIAEDAVVSGMVTELSQKQYLLPKRSLGSIPSHGASAPYNSDNINTNNDLTKEVEGNDAVQANTQTLTFNNLEINKDSNNINNNLEGRGSESSDSFGSLGAINENTGIDMTGAMWSGNCFDELGRSE